MNNKAIAWLELTAGSLSSIAPDPQVRGSNKMRNIWKMFPLYWELNMGPFVSEHQGQEDKELV